MGKVRPNAAGSSHITGKELSMGYRDINSETLHEVSVSQWNISNDTLLHDHDVSREFIDHLAPPEAEAAEAARLYIQVSAAEATEKIHAEEIDVLKQRNVTLENEKDSLDGKVKDGLVDQVHALETTCSSLRDQVSGYEPLKEQIEEFQDAQINIINDKVAKLDADLLEMALLLEEKFYPHLLTTISGRRWLLTHGLKLALVKCLNSQEYLSALGATISRAIEKGMQDGLSADIVHGKEGRSMADVAAYNPAAEAGYNSALQRLCDVDFPLLSKLSSHKNASVKDIMNLLRL
ncbi:hypothetical protein Tco_0317219 [Tanacetum coccineum]